jgi:hypothetical protein
VSPSNQFPFSLFPISDQFLTNDFEGNNLTQQSVTHERTMAMTIAMTRRWPVASKRDDDEG